MRISDWSSDVCSSDLSLYGRANEVDAQIIVAVQAIGFTLGSKMRILLTNDDGVHAPGLEVLETIARTLSDDIWIVAPSEEQSGAGHSLTLSRPVRIREHGKQHYTVPGTPPDACLMRTEKHRE